MKNKEKIPEERNETIRQEIQRLLECNELTIGDLSKAISKPEKELHDHLEHLVGFESLEIIPAECLQCGYIFENRIKTKKPSKCPKCKGTHIAEPIFKTAKP